MKVHEFPGNGHISRPLEFSGQEGDKNMQVVRFEPSISGPKVHFMNLKKSNTIPWVEFQFP